MFVELEIATHNFISMIIERNVEQPILSQKCKKKMKFSSFYNYIIYVLLGNALSNNIFKALL
jgi:hypothetical protein